MGFTPVFRHQIIHETIDCDAYPRPPCPPEKCEPRPPIVAVLGHVDHGKTTLLDALRSSRVVDEEFGGITQHLGAFTVSLSSVERNAGSTDPNPVSFSKSITFLDTPGHAAFSGIRFRSTKATDIMLLVVAADDGVKPQTVEAIRYAKETNTPIVVAINKIDKHDISMDKVVQGLATYEVLTEQLGGDIQAVPISALKRINLSELLDAIILQAELMELKADHTGLAEGVVLESETLHGIGKTATCLITRGVLRKSPNSGPLIAGEAVCTPRILLTDTGKPVDSVNPGFVARVAGWKDLPCAGDLILELESTKRANEVQRYRRCIKIQDKVKEDRDAYDLRASHHREHREKYAEKCLSLHRQRDSAESNLLKENSNQISLPLVIKSDVQGSLEAIKTLLSTYPSDQCKIEYCITGVGPLTESEVDAAAAVNANVLLFNIHALPEATIAAEQNCVKIKEFNIIYRLAEEVRELVNEKLPSVLVEKIIGEAEILQLFTIKASKSVVKTGLLPVAGCRCIKGNIIANVNKIGPILTDLGVDGEPTELCYRIVRPTHHSTSPNNKHGENPTTAEKDFSDSKNTIVDRANCYSLRHEKSTVDSIRKGVDCGIVLVSPEVPDIHSNNQNVSAKNFISQWKVGDIIQCYVTISEKSSVDWDFETCISETPNTRNPIT
ncbi:putative mitochondrial translational initiation factor [Schistosoma mansoni]|uniref:putative mitochondrial translational initiation factor n=1 Tax=Schistosoma mansoni TaxID=6183 RepID=UPI0001A62773|nr:putative mitochondrial translational initiation factor [Schistosoma mansoni]|eukprot:XP_018648810.1 putative mitochondrial translational initiation factor [Schistosoma mansoni]